MKLQILNNLLAALKSAWQQAVASANQLRREYLVEQYLRAGTQYGNAVSALFTGECVDLRSAREHWAGLERHYASLGYRTIPPEEFIECAHGKSLDSLLRVYRASGEEPVFYAESADSISGIIFRPLIDFGGDKRHLPHCHLNDSQAQDTAGHKPEDCNLIGCRIKRERDKQRRSGQWPF